MNTKAELKNIQSKDYKDEKPPYFIYLILLFMAIVIILVSILKN